MKMRSGSGKTIQNLPAPSPAGAAPASVTILAKQPDQVKITWSATAGASGYSVWSGASSTTVNQLIGGVPATGPFRWDAGQLPNSTMYYKVLAIYSNQNLSPGVSAVVAGTTPPVGMNPSGFTATVAPGFSGIEGKVILKWNPIPGAIHYIVQGDGVPRGSDGMPAPITDITYTTQGFGGVNPSWTLYAVYKAPSGDTYWGDENNPARTSMPPIWGYADMHNHQFANLGFGGWMFSGKPFAPGGISKALPACNHPLGVDFIGAGAGQDLQHDMGGDPDFKGWPRWNSTTHQQVYVDWLKRAKDGGLRLMVMLAVNNEVLCGLTAHPYRSCDDMEAVDLQLAAAKDLEGYVDGLFGGPGRGWYRIVRSPQEARIEIGKGNLAVVLGIEVDNLFGCRDGTRCGDVSVPLQKYYNLGVRHVFPIHLTNNGFGGTAVYHDMFNWLNAAVTGRFIDVEGCGSKGVQFKFSQSSTANDAFNTYIKPRLPLSTPYPTTYPNEGQCNKVGLSAQGKYLVQEMMKRHMIIDVDHMSMKAFEDTLNIAEAPQNRYPLASGHTGIMEASTGGKKAEGQRTLAHLKRISTLGGLLGVHTNQGPTEASGGAKGGIAAFPNPAVFNNCSHSSKTWAQVYQYAVLALGGPAQAAVAFGTDFNGLSGEPGPRFGNPQLKLEACPAGDHANLAEKNAQWDMNISRPVDYPFTLPGIGTFGKGRWGNKEFDINQDGLAHIGLLPDFIADLKKIRLTDDQLKPLFRSAEAYITMWEKTYVTH